MGSMIATRSPLDDGVGLVNSFRCWGMFLGMVSSTKDSKGVFQGSLLPWREKVRACPGLEGE